ncbi:hypothetical protein KFK09_021781 [Dendrobium nobile]|uniref:Uncharacterized protein n=1 Tax=Dendrobium nobile TaxID=94219 RepID=A0A8T3AH68_DENNO|nr:hypothetical protein KFK09_021781 [Dendrobium nobile]
MKQAYQIVAGHVRLYGDMAATGACLGYFINRKETFLVLKNPRKENQGFGRVGERLAEDVWLQKSKCFCLFLTLLR